MRLSRILAIALVLRVAGLGWGLPHVYHQDEPIVVNHALAIGVEGWNTRTYLPPQFASYALFFVYAGYFLLGRAFGVFKGAQDFGLAFLKDPTVFYLLARFFFGVVFGLLAVWLLWRLASRFYSRTIAGWAALLLAMNFMHVQHGHYVYMDVALSAALLLTFHAALKAQESSTLTRALALGAAFGWAVSVKYTAAYFFPLVAAALIFSDARGRDKLRFLAAAAFCSLAVYAAVSPYSFLDWNNFISQVRSQSGARGWAGWSHHLVYSLSEGCGPQVLLLAAVGAASALTRYRGPSSLLLAAAVLYYLVNVYFSQPFSRYMMPLVPLVCLFAAVGWERLAEHLRKRELLKKALLALLLITVAAPVLASDLLFMTTDTRTLCARWMDRHVPAGAAVVIDRRFFGPPLLQSREQLQEKHRMLGSKAGAGARAKRLELAERALEGRKAYRVYYGAGVAAEQESAAFLFSRPRMEADWAALEAAGIQYLVLNYTDPVEAFQELKNGAGPRLKLEASFGAYFDPTRRTPRDRYSSTAAPVDWVSLFKRRRLGPYLEVYRVRPE